MQEHHLFRILGLLLLSLYATAAILKPSTAISKPSNQNIPASQSSTPPIIDTDPSTWPNTQINYHSIPGTDSVQDTRAAAASTEDTGKAGMDSNRKRKEHHKPESEEDRFVYLNQAENSLEQSIG